MEEIWFQEKVNLQKTSSLTLDKYGISGYGPRGITVLDDVNKIYVCDTFGNRVHIFDKNGKFIKSLERRFFLIQFQLQDIVKMNLLY